jgi:tetrapyrrole methylase family protein / MazG family protein
MKHTYDELVEIVRRLRKECPWDREQTHESIRQNLIEEAYEVIDAIDAGDADELKKELGDLLLHVVFHAVIAEESNKFTLNEVVSLIAEKLIRRHPHIFGDTVVNGKEDVIRNWEKIKLEEGRNSVVDGVPSALPALVRALRLQEKASKVGFDWESKDDCWKKVEEEIYELKSAVERNTDQLTIEDELGDLLFSLVNYSRFLKINPEDALRKTNQKFIARFQNIENTLREQGKDIHRSTLDEMDQIWETAKENRRKGKK